MGHCGPKNHCCPMGLSKMYHMLNIFPFEIGVKCSGGDYIVYSFLHLTVYVCYHFYSSQSKTNLMIILHQIAHEQYIISCTEQLYR